MDQRLEPNAARRILDLLKGAPPQTAEALATRLGITPVAMRLKLNALAGKGLVRFVEQKGRVGRPLRVWSLTEAAGVTFPDAHAALAVDLLEGVKQLYGKKALRRLVVAREKDMLDRYTRALAPAKTITARVAKLAELRSEEGYMAETRKTARGQVLIENHCPICAAASACQQFCRSELRIFQKVLGDDTKVERIDHVLAGARRCAYLITPRRD